MGAILYDEDDNGLYDRGLRGPHGADGTSAGGTWTTEIARHTVGWRFECSRGWVLGGR